MGVPNEHKSVISIWSRVPELGSDPPIGSNRESGRDKLVSEPRFRNFLMSLRLRMYLHSNVLD